MVRGRWKPWRVGAAFFGPLPSVPAPCQLRPTPPACARCGEWRGVSRRWAPVHRSPGRLGNTVEFKSLCAACSLTSMRTPLPPGALLCRRAVGADFSARGLAPPHNVPCACTAAGDDRRRWCPRMHAPLNRPPRSERASPLGVRSSCAQPPCSSGATSYRAPPGYWPTDPPGPQAGHAREVPRAAERPQPTRTERAPGPTRTRSAAASDARPHGIVELTPSLGTSASPKGSA